MSIFRTSIAIAPENINVAISSASKSTTEQEPETVQESVGDMAENQMVASAETPVPESTNPIISLDSGFKSERLT